MKIAESLAIGRQSQDIVVETIALLFQGALKAACVGIIVTLIESKYSLSIIGGCQPYPIWTLGLCKHGRELDVYDGEVDHIRIAVAVIEVGNAVEQKQSMSTETCKLDGVLHHGCCYSLPTMRGMGDDDANTPGGDSSRPHA